MILGAMYTQADICAAKVLYRMSSIAMSRTQEFSGLQALTELLFLPPPIAAFVQHQVAAFQAPLAITVVEPGHCLWQVRKASVAVPAVVVEPTAGPGNASLLECAVLFSMP